MSTPGTPPTSASDPVFERLRRAFASGELTLFVGAGISSAAGLPSWKALVETVVTTVRQRGTDALRLEEIEGSLTRGQLIDALTAAKDALGSPVQFCNLVEQQLDDTDRKVPDVGQAIAQLSPGLRAILTTNLDRLLERALQWQWPVLVRPTGDLPQQRRYILHLHGTLRERDSWVMTREDYDHAMYANPQLQGAVNASVSQSISSNGSNQPLPADSPNITENVISTETRREPQLIPVGQAFFHAQQDLHVGDMQSPP